jgi:TraM recognition site of TraD and TraG
MHPNDDMAARRGAGEAGVAYLYDAEPDVILDLVPAAITRCGFDDPKVERASRVATGTRRREYDDPLRGVERTMIEVSWEPGPAPGSTAVAASLFEPAGGRRRAVRDGRGELGLFHAVLADLVARRDDRDTPPHNPVIGPGEPFDGRFSGNLRDYSPCATPDDIQDLLDGVLPLGRLAFGRARDRVAYGPPLFLSTYRTGAPIEHNGILLCAPQKSGKTSLIVRMAEAANRAGYGTFLIDVKGNLRAKLDGKLAGKIFHFSTDPKVAACDRINFLAGLDPTTPEGTERIQGLVAAILPAEAQRPRGDEEDFHFRNKSVWLTALIHLVKLLEFYRPDLFHEADGTPRSADLGDLYRYAVDEEELVALLHALGEIERDRRGRGLPVPPCGADHWSREIANLIHPDRMPGGQRDRHLGYRAYSQGLVSALEPFSEHGTLCRKVRDRGEGELFSLEDLGRGDGPVTIILSAREQDLERAETVLAMAVRQLQHYLFERVNQDGVRPVLLLLDETRRIRSFEANRYITFAREAKAGCVVVYQSLDQIGDERAISEILENVGAQIYLGGLSGNTAKYFMASLPRRHRANVSVQTSYGPEGSRRTESVVNELVEYLTTNELYELPAGEWPALVYINDQPRRRPILVDMGESL